MLDIIILGATGKSGSSRNWLGLDDTANYPQVTLVASLLDTLQHIRSVQRSRLALQHALSRNSKLSRRSWVMLFAKSRHSLWT